MKRTLHHSNKTRVELKCHMVTYTMMKRAEKRSEQLAYWMAEYVITEEAEKLAEKWRGRKTCNLATEVEHMGEISVLILTISWVLKPSNYFLVVKIFSFLMYDIFSVYSLSAEKRTFWHLEFSLCNYVIALRNKKYIHSIIPFRNEP